MPLNTSTENLESAKKRAVISILLNIFLAVVKGAAGVVSGSTALIGDAIHSTTDVLASTAVFVGIWVAGRKHPSFPYGLYKAETVATLVTSLAVILAGYEIGRQALLGVNALPDVTIALPVAAGSLVIALTFGLLQLRAGKRLSSPALVADARDYLADSLSTGVVLVGLVAAKFGYNIDRWAAGVVALFVFYAGGHLLVGAIRDLLDASIDRETEREIIRFVEDHPRITRVKRCLSRIAGGRFIVDMDVVMHTPSHKIADQVADRLEEDIPVQFPRVVMARIRPHYGRGKYIRRMSPVDGPGGDFSPQLAGAPWFLLETIRAEDDRVEKREFIENIHATAEKRRGLLVGQWLLSLKPDEMLTEGSGGAVVVLLREAGVDIVQPSLSSTSR